MFLSRRIPFSIPGQVNGAITYFNGTEWVILPPGTAGYYLRTGGPGNPPFWSTAPTFTIAGEAAGDLVYFNGTIWTRLPIGSAGNVLTVSTGTPAWAAPTPFTVPGAAHGDMLYYDGTAWALIAAGGAGKVLTANGMAAPTWQTPLGPEKVRVAAATSGAAGAFTVSLTVPNGLPAAGTVRIYEVNAAIKQGTKWETTYLRITVDDTPALQGTDLIMQDDNGLTAFATSPSAILSASGTDLVCQVKFNLGAGVANYRVSVQEA